MTTIRNRHPNTYLGVIFLVVVAFLLLTACGKSEVRDLPPPPPAVEVKVAVPVPCQIEQVTVPAYPAKQARKGDDIHTLAKIALADRRVRMGETAELRAANTTPCPTQ